MAQVEIYFVTNRNHIPENKRAVFGAHFNPDGVAALRFGKAIYEVHGRDAVFKSIDVYPDAKVLPGQTTVPPSGSGRFLDDIRREMFAGRDTIVFIHGFNVSFMEALASAALLAASIPHNINLVVFSWPSDGEAIPYMSYYSDREDARARPGGAAHRHPRRSTTSRTTRTVSSAITALFRAVMCQRHRCPDRWKRRMLATLKPMASR